MCKKKQQMPLKFCDILLLKSRNVAVKKFVFLTTRPHI